MSTSPQSRLSPETLAQLADDAFTVLNWARRLGMNRERQIEQVVKTFEIRLGYRQAEARRGETEAGGS